MQPMSDARLWVRFGPMSAATPDEALLIEGDAPAPENAVVARFGMSAFGFGQSPPGRLECAPSGAAGHPQACACCLPRGGAALALGSLFMARARGEVGLFRAVRVVSLTEAGEAAVRRALATDPVVLARFRLEPPM